MAEFIGATIIIFSMIGVVVAFLRKKECKEDPNLEDMIKKIDKLSDKEIATLKQKVDELC